VIKIADAPLASAEILGYHLSKPIAGLASPTNIALANSASGNALVQFFVSSDMVVGDRPIRGGENVLRQSY
jgi:hypothetical protein